MASREGELPLLRLPMLYNPARAESASKPLEGREKSIFGVHSCQPRIQPRILRPLWFWPCCFRYSFLTQ